ncbi:MAG: DUF3499 family protein [Acidimicrobiia bacterium]
MVGGEQASSTSPSFSSVSGRARATKRAVNSSQVVSQLHALRPATFRDVAERCSRTQCSAPAAARVAFDALTRFVWIDPFEADGPLDVSARGAGALCARHADHLVAPRGWAVQDRRGRDLQLWSDRPAPQPAPVVEGARAPTPSPRIGSVTVLEQPLPFDAAAPAPEPTPAPSAYDDIDDVLDAARSPLLSRAFNAALPRHVS